MNEAAIVLTATQAGALAVCLAFAAAAGVTYVGVLHGRLAAFQRGLRHIGEDATRVRAGLLEAQRREALAWDFARRCWRGEFDAIRLEQMGATGRAALTAASLRAAQELVKRPL